MIQSNEKVVHDLKEQLLLAENGKNSAFEKQLELFESQRREFQVRIEAQHKEIIDKDRTITNLEHKLERM